jgi:hypothetical protein
MVALRSVVPAVLCVASLAVTGCTTLSTSSPVLVNRLKVVSAGHTGCQPADNQISNTSDTRDGVTWNATCKGRVYLCSGASPRGAGESYGCTLAAQ